jgi:hypothetical protein
MLYLVGLPTALQERLRNSLTDECEVGLSKEARSQGAGRQVAAANQEAIGIKKRLGLGPAKLRGAKPSPLATRTRERRPKLAPSSDRIPRPAPADDFMHAPKEAGGQRDGCDGEGTRMTSQRGTLNPSLTPEPKSSSCSRLRAWRNSQSEKDEYGLIDPKDIPSSSRPTRFPSLDLGIVVILSTIKRLAKCRPLFSLGSMSNRMRRGF